MSFEIPHKDDLATNSKLPGQLTENFKVLEHEDHDDDTRLDQEIQNRKDADAKEAEEREITDSKLTDRLNRFDQEKATHDDVNDLRDELLKKIKHIILGTDEETVKTVIQEMKKEGTI